VFTGIIETIGTVRDLRRRRDGRSVALGVCPDAKEYSVAIGGSVALDGVCLTLESVRDDIFYFTAVAETLDRSTVLSWRAGERVNMERALALCDRLDGHFVLGHVDAAGTIVSDRSDGDATVRTIRVPVRLMPFCAEKGSVAIDGVSLTIAAVAQDTIEVSLVPFTIEKTTITSKRSGDRVNIECDVIARYLARLMAGKSAQDAAKVATGNLFDTMERSGF
jgi:riboflavin synthase